MEKVLLSEALTVNLSHTHDQIIEIPNQQKWLAELSLSTWGIHNRIQEFLNELNHKYRNDRHVVELLHTICLQDFWFYYSLPQSEAALSVVMDIFGSLFASVKDKDVHELLITTLLKFINHLSTQSDFPPSLVLRCFSLMEADMERYELLYIRNSGYLKTCLHRIAQNSICLPVVLRHTFFMLERCIDYWQRTTQAEEWFQSRAHLFSYMEADSITAIGIPFFEQLRSDLQQAQTWEDLRRLMFYNDIASYFRCFADKFTSSRESIYYYYYLLHLPGMSHLYDHLLYDINRKLRSVFKELRQEDIPGFLDSIIGELRQLRTEYSRTVLDCIATLGKEVLGTDDDNSISHFISSLIQFGFSYPGEPSLNSDWQVQINPNHIQNIRVYLGLIEQNPAAMRRLINALIVELKLGGIYISDTDLFQRDVTQLLNADIAPVYREIKQLARIFPVFFRDIGAEGRLRQVSTTLDALSLRKDHLIHFLRVQIHVESNNTNIMLARRIIEWWYHGDKQALKEMLPEDVYEELDVEDYWYATAHSALTALCHELELTLSEMLKLSADSIQQRVLSLYPEPDEHQSRVMQLFQIHALLLEKYSFEAGDVAALVRNSRFFTRSEAAQLEQEMKSGDYERCIRQIYSMMQRLKTVILQPHKTEPTENIHYKRHIAAGIPSTYGQYMEPKFEALGLMYRLERVVSKLMDKLLQPFSGTQIAVDDFKRAYSLLLLFQQGLELDGIQNRSFDTHLEMFKYSLNSTSFSLSQFINIFQFIAHDVGQIIRKYFFDSYEQPLSLIMPQVLPQLQATKSERSRERMQMEREKFLRDVLSSAFLLQALDQFITNLVGTLRSMVYAGFITNDSPVAYERRLLFSRLDQDTPELDHPVFLGAKAFFLKKMARHAFPVPPGFIITSEAFRQRVTLYTHDARRHEFEAAIDEHIVDIEQATGKKFGDAANPLLVSVRSGSFVSLPGAMMTLLNVGMNDEIAEKLSHREGFNWTAWDCYRRFLQSWGMGSGVEREVFDQLLLHYKRKQGVELKLQLPAAQMRNLAYEYKQVLLDRDINIPDAPREQLHAAIRCVLDSWSSQSAVSFRDYMQLAPEWGTAVLVQQMVFGNISPSSGSGVAFTGSPLDEGGGVSLYGDFTVCSQGEDVVSGFVNTLPISEAQRARQYSETCSLESAFPQVYQALYTYAERLINQYGLPHQEIEFTFESDRPENLYILQIRKQNVLGCKTSDHFAASPQEMQLVGQGIGVGGGVLSGVIAFDILDMNRIREISPAAKIILVRSDTVPDDIPMLFICDGLITAKGGATSHAAMTAVGLGKVCIVKCRGLLVYEGEKRCVINGHQFVAGDAISIDSGLGNIYCGHYEIIKQ